MSKSTEADACVSPVGNAWGRRTHLNWSSEAAVARELGVQVRAMCGVWNWPAPKPGRPSDPRRPRCKRCEVAYEASQKRGWRLIR